MKIKFDKVSVEEVKTPKDGYTVLVNRYWIATPDLKYVCFYKKAPQCNDSEKVVNYLLESNTHYKGYISLFLPVSYIPPRYA